MTLWPGQGERYQTRKDAFWVYKATSKAPRDLERGNPLSFPRFSDLATTQRGAFIIGKYVEIMPDLHKLGVMK